MHELGVVFYAIDAVEDAIADRDDVGHVNKVTIKLGEVSGVVPHLLQDCWNWAVSKRENMRGCELEIQNIGAFSHCENCNSNYKTIEHGRVCPFCGSDKTSLICGNEFIIESVQMGTVPICPD